MAITYLSGQRLQGLSSDTKPTDLPLGSQFEETDTFKIYQSGGGADVQISNENEDDNIAFSKVVGASKYGYKFASDHYLVGRVVKSVWYKIKSTGSQSVGVLSVYAGQSASTGNNTLIGSVNATAISTSVYTWYEFTDTGTHEIVADDHIWLTTSTTATVNLGVRYFANAPTYGAIPYDFWGSGDALPDGNTLGTTDAGTTYVTYRNTEIVSDPDVVAPLDGATTAHPMIIKVDSAPPAWVERGTAI